MGPYLDEIKRLESEVKSLREEIAGIRAEVVEMSRRLEVAELRLAGGDSDVDLEARVYSLILNGHSSPTEISSMLGISKDRLYRILNKLIRNRLVMAEGRGRGRRYIPRVADR